MSDQASSESPGPVASPVVSDATVAPVSETVELSGEQVTLLSNFDDACDHYVRALKAAADGGVPPALIQVRMMSTLQALGAPAELMQQAANG